MFYLPCFFLAMTSAIERRTSQMKVDIPPPIRSNIPGTWAYDTMNRRIPDEILPRIINDNIRELSNPTSSIRSEILLILNDLQSSLKSGNTGYLRGISDSGEDVDVWNSILADVPDDKRNWIDAPWALSEFYFYRRIIEAFKYFETGYDPFIGQKGNGLIESLSNIENIALKLPSLLSREPHAILSTAILTSLWGNKMDLSLWPADKSNSEEKEERVTKFDKALNAGSKYLLDNDLDEVVYFLQSIPGDRGSRIDIIVDNAGFEIVTDLILALCHLKLSPLHTVVLHTKGHPTFVSDATTQDVYATINFLSEPFEGSAYPAAEQLARDLRAYIAEDRLRMIDDLFWCQPTAFWDMPHSVKERLTGSSMIFVKGDANYRRLLGDRHWKLDEDPREVLNYWGDLPICALRVCKAEIACGIPVSEQVRAKTEDPNWLVSGKWGVIQFNLNRK